jgi:hypothetical protein
MKIKYKSYKIKSDAVGPNLIQFNEEGTRKATLNMLGIDPNLSDEELDGYNTAFAASLLDFSKMNDDDNIPVLTFLKNSIDEKRQVVETINKEIQDDWDAGSRPNNFGTIVIVDPETEEDLIKDVESNPNFEGWIDEYYLDDLVSPEVAPLIFSNRYYKINDLVVIVPENAFSVMDDLLAIVKNHNMTFEEIFEIDLEKFEDDSIINIYNFMDLHRPKNIKQTLVDMVVDWDETEIENKDLVPKMPSGFGANPDFHSADNVDSFNEDDIFNKFLSI